MATTQKELIPQLIRLFHTAGLIQSAEWKAYAVRQGKNKPILDVLTQEVSLDSFKDLLTAEITLKSKRFGLGAEAEMHESLSISGMVNIDELQSMLSVHRPSIQSILEPLRASGVLSTETVEQIQAKAEAGNVDIYEWMLAEEIVTTKSINHWLGNHQSTELRSAALFIALQILQYNRLIMDEEFLEWVRRLHTGGSDEIVKLLSGKGLSSKKLVEKIEEGLALPQVKLEQMEIPASSFDQFPQSWIRRQLIVPFYQDEHAIGAATADALNYPLTALVHWITGRWMHLYFSPSTVLIDKINHRYEQIPETGGLPAVEMIAAASLVPAERTPVLVASGATGNESKKTNGNAGRLKKTATLPQATLPVPPAAGPSSAMERMPTMPHFENEMLSDNVSAVQLVSSLIESAIAMRTTDIHMEPAREGMLVRFRIDGNLHRILTVPQRLVASVTSRVKILGNMDVTERRRPQDGHFELRVEKNAFDFRISSLPGIQGEKLVIRILEPARVLKGLGDLGLLPEQQDLVDQMLRRPQGMLLVTGPTGSGKTSTLYSALSLVNSEKRNIVTIEDPVEYQIPGINQVQVDMHVGLTFSEGLRSILRQDPDVIMVGEIRDSDTARIAIRSAMTGHLVFSTLHTNTALGSVDALVHLGVVPFMVASSISGIIAQRLVRLLCPDCKTSRTMGESLAGQLGLTKGSARKKVYNGAGCASCLGTGFLGRSGVFEVIKVNDKIRPLIAVHESIETLEAAARKAKFMSLREAGVQKVLAGVTSAEEVAEKILLEL